MKRLLVAILGVMLAACTGADGPEACDPSATTSTCFENYRCDVATKQCLRTCAHDSDCIDSQFCDLPAGETAGVCRFGEAPGGDSSTD